jgi:hypothetical protein
MQKTLLSLVQIICAEIAAPTPTVVISSTDANVLKILALLHAACNDLLYEYDWQVLQVRETFSTVADQQAYTLPDGYARAINGTFFDASNRWPLKIVTPTQWEIINIWNVTASPFMRLRLFGNELKFFPVPNAVYNLVYDYVSSYYVLDASTGAMKADFTTDSDICAFDAHLVTRLVKYKYWAALGKDTTTALGEYQRILGLAKGQDKPAMRLSLIPQTLPLLSTNNIPDASWITS